MGVKSYDQPSVTGISNSGTTDQNGAWSTGIDVSSQLADFPAGAGGLLIKTVNNTSSPRWCGVRTNGKIASEFQVDLQVASSRFDFIPFSGSNFQIDFYRESTDIVFHVVLVLDQTWTFFNVDATRPSIASASGTPTQTTVSECPAGATIITSGFKWRPTGETSIFTNQTSGQQLVKLDGSKNFDNASSTTQTVYGYTTGTVNWLPWLAVTQAYTADGTWRSASNEYAGLEALFLSTDKTGAAIDFDFRRRGSAYSPGVGSNADENFYTGLNASGQWDYLIESGASTPLYVMATMPNVETTAVSITNIDQLISGENSTVTISSPSYAATQAAISDGVTSKIVSVSGGSGTFIFSCPSRIDGDTAVRYGAVTVTLSDGADPTDPFADEYEPPAGFGYIDLTSVDPGNYGVGYSPALKIGSQCQYKSDEFLIGSGGVGESVGDFVGDTAVSDIDPDDRTARVGIVSVSGQQPSTSIGITAKPITAQAITAQGITAR